MRLSWKYFGGIMPKISPRNLPDNAAQTAQNCWLAETTLEPIHDVGSGDPTGIGPYMIGGSGAANGPLADSSEIYQASGGVLNCIGGTSPYLAAPAKPVITKSRLWNPTGFELIYTGTYIEGSSQLIKTATIQSSAYWTKSYSIAGGTEELVFTNPGSTFSSTGPAANVWVPSRAITGAGTFKIVYGATTVDPVPSDTEITVGVLKMKVVDVAIVNTTNTDGLITSQRIIVNISLDDGRTSAQSVYYVQTTVSGGHESPPSSVSDLVEWGVGEQLTITNGVSGGRLYRSATGASNSDFYFVVENPGTDYIDSKPDSQLAEVMPQIEHPPLVIDGIIALSGGSLAGFSGKEIYFSEPWIPYSWPSRYQITLDFTVVGLAVQGTDLVALTTGNPYVISGSHPEIMTQTKLAVNQSCVSRGSIAFQENIVLYASPDGLVSLSGGSATIVTSKMYTRDQWQALGPSNLVGAIHDGRYCGFFADSGIIIDFKEPNAALTTTTIGSTFAYSDLVTDILYLSSSRTWRTSATALTAIWKSKEYQNVQDAIWTSAKVIAASYTNTVFKIFADGSLVWTYTVTSSDGFRVPKLDRSARWSIQIETEDIVYEVIVASNMTLLRRIDGIPPT